MQIGNVEGGRDHKNQRHYYDETDFGRIIHLSSSFNSESKYSSTGSTSSSGVRSKNCLTRGCVLALSSSSVPVAIKYPLSSTVTRSAIRKALAISCVTTTMVI